MKPFKLRKTYKAKYKAAIKRLGCLEPILSNMEYQNDYLYLKIDNLQSENERLIKEIENLKSQIKEKNND